jgi:hypothetical protein
MIMKRLLMSLFLAGVFVLGPHSYSFADDTPPASEDTGSDDGAEGSTQAPEETGGDSSGGGIVSTKNSGKAKPIARPGPIKSEGKMIIR